MIKTLARRVGVFSLMLLVSACGVFGGDDGYFRNRGGDYQKADKIAPIKVPEGMSDQRLGKLYPIPPLIETDFEQTTSYDNDVPRPEPLATNLMQENIKIQRLGEERWMLMNVSPGEVWPRVRSFLNENNVDVASADISRGLIDSHWLQFKTDLSTIDRYRVQIDQGVQPETSEIHILHQSVAGDKPPESAEWPQASTSKERESWLLDEMAAALAADATLGGTSLLAQAIGGEAKSGLVVEASEPVMKLRLNEARAKATLFHAMKENGFAIYDSAAGQDVYYLHFESPEAEDEGWFSGWFSGDEKIVHESPYTVEQLLTQVPSGDAFVTAPLSAPEKESQFPDAPGYLLFVKGGSGDYTIHLRDAYGKRLEPRLARQLLTVLRTNLI
ncbi:outer membrane protein assembly factor BamC [Gilvimarinus agarilyticus]|uniref:outer membrane protein assembly factor BamC n=1 Tax=unclassified Gilvimarinus TaxID=2642066 RepID=UPI001C08741F|nr:MULTISPECIES: outer membrane protein assembly factor BamC [unclassified Gilvimarinus]MBU2885021.1 outer membrane protein assembly factor BamC [Gilvimarinus agarilyticus]MDO6569918.1 outer membrane protein assembly factor BamC [Gilvimarinus sp. 2_MG-2023]MDO6747127.1 outer membrane protein assembly factor BamC [Gilvimarinus sp. 1_MG-2023]